MRHFTGVTVLAGLIASGTAWAQGVPHGLTLREAMDQALKNNLQSRVSAERVTEAEAGRAIARSALLPQVSGAAYQVNLTANLAAQGLTLLNFPGIPAFIGPFNRFDARFQVAQSLFNLQSIRGYQARRLGVELAAEHRKLAEQQVITQTALAYIAALEAGQAVSAAEANVQLSRRLLDLAVSQKTAGIATGLDVARAETRLASQQVQLAQAKTNLDSARLTLQRVAGLPLGSQMVLADKMEFVPAPAPPVNAVLEQALSERVEIRAAAAHFKLAESEKKAALAGWAPSVSAFADYGSSGLKPNEVNLPTRTVGVRIDVPIFNGGRTRAEAQAAASRVRQAELQLADMRLGVEKDVRLALENLATREEQMRAAGKNLDLAERELNLAQDRFRNGVADNVEVTNAQTALENARLVVVSSLAQFNVARLNLDSARGRAGDFQFR